MDRFDAMSLFLAVVECGSLSAAGRKLGMPLATVSRRISELEARLKTRLLTRSTRQLSLTDAGRTYVAACKRIVEDVNETERVATGEYSAPRGELIVTAPIVFGRLHILPITIDFLKAYPEVDLRLVLSDRIVNLLDDHIDLAVRIGELPDSSLIARRVGTVRRIVCASPTYLAQQGRPHVLQDLSRHSCLRFETGLQPEPWIFRLDGTDVAIPVRARLSVNTAEAAIDAAVAGLGLSRVLSYPIKTVEEAGLLSIVLQEFEPPPIPVSLIYPAQTRLPLKLRAFIDFVVPRLKERL